MTTPEFTANRENFCYRHPDRQSFVLCQRCLRTICPECQTQGPVGVICPECLKAQRKAETPAQRRARRQWGMSSAADGKPIVTYAIMAVTSLVSLIAMIPGIGTAITNALAFFAPYLYPQLSGVFEPWRLFTAMLVHGGFIHLALNMLALWMIGRSLEPMLGRWRYLTLYILSGLGGSVMVACLDPIQATVGASGAIFGLMAALLIVGRHLGANVTGILVILVINFVWGFTQSGTISWQAHLGGAVVGALVAFIYTRTKRAKQRGLQIGLLSVVGVGLLLIVALVPPALISAGVFS